MSVEKIAKELEAYTSTFNFKQIIMGDDNIGPIKERTQKICNLMKKHNLEWHTGIRCEYMTDEIAQMLDNSNCTSLFFGVESGSNRILKDIVGKDYPNGVKDIKNCVKYMAKTNMTGMYSFMCGLPTETKKELKMSMKLADWIKVTDKNARISFYVYAPYPGTAMYKDALKKGFQEPEKMSDWVNITLSTSQNPRMENLYYISGLRFRKDKTSQNFPGWKRLKIKPFEISASLRWRTGILAGYWEKLFVKRLIEKASIRSE